MSDVENKDSEDLVSQEELDELLKEVESQPDDSPVGEETTDLDLVSPEDIERLLETNSASLDLEQEGEESELDLISQDDIDELVSGEELSGGESSDGDDSDDALISQDDIDALLGNADTAADSSDPGKSADATDESLISQDDIDALLGGADPVLDENDGVDGTASDDTDASLISQEDIDSLLNDVGADDSAAEEQLVTQDDIENLLAADESPEQPELVDSGENAVSQEDIDKLLNADIEDDEEENEEIIEEAVSNQVILEKSEEEQEVEEKKGLKKWLTNKIVIGCSIAAFLLVAAGVSYVVFKGGGEPEVAETAEMEEIRDDAADSYEVDTPEIQPPTEDSFVVVELRDFVVPAPLAMKDISYISLDLTLEIVDVTSDPIKGYEPFFRNIIYEVLNKALELQSESKVIEADLIKMIMKALNDALSEGSVNKASFMEFKIT